jgi:hypothetical protein
MAFFLNSTLKFYENSEHEMKKYSNIITYGYKKNKYFLAFINRFLNVHIYNIKKKYSELDDPTPYISYIEKKIKYGMTLKELRRYYYILIKLNSITEQLKKHYDVYNTFTCSGFFHKIIINIREVLKKNNIKIKDEEEIKIKFDPYENIKGKYHKLYLHNINYLSIMILRKINYYEPDDDGEETNTDDDDTTEDTEDEKKYYFEYIIKDERKKENYIKWLKKNTIII